MARKSKMLPGFTRIPGSARRVRTPDGSTISRRQYENHRLGKAGYRSWSQYQSIKRGTAKGLKQAQGEDTKKTFKRWLDRAKQQTGLPTGTLTEPDSEFNRLLAKAADDEFSLDAKGSFHDFLVYLGYRTDSQDFDTYLASVQYG